MTEKFSQLRAYFQLFQYIVGCFGKEESDNEIADFVQKERMAA